MSWIEETNDRLTNDGYSLGPQSTVDFRKAVDLLNRAAEIFLAYGPHHMPESIDWLRELYQ